jgi:thiol-disulfide isomerase/thioredoxin
MTFKELDFLVRQHTPENEIVSDVAQRKLVAPIDDRVAQVLKHSGATDGLLARLQAPSMSLSPEASRVAYEQAVAQQARALQAARQEVAARAPALQNQGSGPAQPPAIPITHLLDGKLVKLDGDTLKAYDIKALEKVRVFAFYYSAMWCGPCRKTTPQLVAAYAQLKAQHPEFELIFVSRDRDEFNMSEYMRSQKMPWPAIRFDAASDTLQQFAGGSIPWLVCVSDTGHALTTNGVDKKYLDPETVLNAIPSLLAMAKR